MKFVLSFSSGGEAINNNEGLKTFKEELQVEEPKVPLENVKFNVRIKGDSRRVEGKGGEVVT